MVLETHTYTDAKDTLTVFVKNAWVPDPVHASLKEFQPNTELGFIIKRCFDYLPLPLALELLDQIKVSIVMESQLEATVIRGCPSHRLTPCECARVEEHYGVVSHKLVTAVGVLYICNNFAATASYSLGNFNFHGIGTGVTAEAATDQTLVTELTTEYNPNSTRATGTGRTAAAAGNNATYQTIGTNTLDSGTPAVTEHGLFTQAATGAYAAPANVLLDRSVFSAINLVGANGDGLQTTYTITVNSGG